MPWYVLYTKSRSEILVAKTLQNRGIETYCPVQQVQRKWSDRVKLIEVPLFRSYCFVNLPEADRAKVFGTPGLVAYLYWLKKPAVVRPCEIELIKNILNDFDHKSLEINSFSPTDRLRVKSGVLMDQEGEVVTIQGKTLTIKLESLSAYITIDMTRNKIEKLSNYQLPVCAH
ncbi:UpxY family transcription antiterminator [Spirosoma aerophilum]